MEATKTSTANNTAASCCAPAGRAGWLNCRNMVIGALLLAVGGAIFFGWSWLVATGFATMILGVLPCLVMCALGICANRIGKKEPSAAAAPLPPQDSPAEPGIASSSVEPSATRVAAPHQAEKRVA